ncbi:magnesium transporter [Blautia glucerasea]|uniref:magnesium transporter n=1 Tax=Blautia TaxID=572511 RepID=UPI0015708185|nr:MULTISPECIES: magnesium transporter [Blautia]MCB5549098.1 magnesium transporter [Blautia sp. MSK17_66]MCB6370797.1 magnesium transporter [Blautia glucerasea]NSK00775.1 magnesium transporter [Blautia obeum]
MENRTQNYAKEILDIIKSNVSPAVLSKRLQDFHENDLAEVLPELSSAERSKIYRIFDLDTLSDILEYTDEETAVTYLEEMNLKKAAAILSRIETNVLSDILQHFDKEKRRLLIELLDDDVRHDVEMINTFDDEEIGSRMTTNCIIINNHLSVKGAMSALVSQAAQNDNISTIFVVNDNQEFYGAIDLKDLIIARQDHPLDELVVTSYPYVYGTALIDDCIEDLKDYSEDSIPVLDNDNRLIGVITSANIVDLVDDEMGEDYAKFAGLTAEEDLQEPLKESMKKRMPWLVILLGLGMIVSSVVGIFEKVVTNLPIIMCFQSLILDMAGNVGTQSLAVTIRVLMDESLTGRQKLELVFKEMRIGLCNGGLLGLMSFVLIGLYIWLFKGKTLVFAYAVSACIGCSLLLAMLISSAVGTCIPLFFKKIHIDPAVASGPLITTINDLVAVISYYGMSWIFLIEILHLAG